MPPFKTEWCEAIADEDLAAGDLVLAHHGHAMVAHDWSGASGVVWRVVIPAKRGMPATLITVKPAST